jgi:predicted nucleotidyltransferase
MMKNLLLNNLDRFSSPLDSERVHPFLMAQMIQEQQELNKIDLVDQYISSYWNQFYLVPDTEDIQEHFYQLDIDQDLIKERLELF